MATKKTVKKNAWQKSEFGKLNLVDFLNSIYYPLVYMLVQLGEMLANGDKIDIADLKIAAGVFGLSLVKRLFQAEKKS